MEYHRKILILRGIQNAVAEMYPKTERIDVDHVLRFTVHYTEKFGVTEKEVMEILSMPLKDVFVGEEGA